jgi:hypothetical protein
MPEPARIMYPMPKMGAVTAATSPETVHPERPDAKSPFWMTMAPGHE